MFGHRYGTYRMYYPYDSLLVHTLGMAPQLWSVPSLFLTRSNFRWVSSSAPRRKYRTGLPTVGPARPNWDCQQPIVRWPKNHPDSQENLAWHHHLLMGPHWPHKAQEVTPRTSKTTPGWRGCCSAEIARPIRELFGAAKFTDFTCRIEHLNISKPLWTSLTLQHLSVATLVPTSELIPNGH